MDTTVIGIVGALIGVLLAFRGQAMLRLIISLVGAFAGFLLGTGVGMMLTASMLLSSILGIIGALLFGVLAYASYRLAIIVAMGFLGFAIGSTAMSAIGAASDLAILGVGVLAGIALAIVALLTDLPAIILVVLTALAGASFVVTSVLILTGGLPIAQLSTDQVMAEMGAGWVWYALYFAVAGLGALVQLRSLSGHRRSMRQQWAHSYAPMPTR